MEQQREFKLIRKLCEVMQAVRYIEKRGYNREQNYKYAQEADIVEAIREELAKRFVFLKHDVKEKSFRTITTRKGTEITITTLEIEFTFIDGETGERESFRVVSEGQDTMDKGVYKALTGGLKYALMKSFLIPTGDDPERDDEPAEPEQPTGRANINGKPEGKGNVKQFPAKQQAAGPKGSAQPEQSQPSKQGEDGKQKSVTERIKEGRAKIAGRLEELGEKDKEKANQEAMNLILYFGQNKVTYQAALDAYNFVKAPETTLEAVRALLYGDQAKEVTA